MMFIQVETTFLFNEVKLTIYKKQKNKNLKIINLNEKYSYTYALSLKKKIIKKKFKKNCNQNTNKCQKSYSHHIRNPFPNPFVLLFNKKKGRRKN